MAPTALAAAERPLDVRLARAALHWTLDRAHGADEEVADQLLVLAAGNRTAVTRALGRVADHGPAAGALRLALARGTWAW